MSNKFRGTPTSLLIELSPEIILQSPLSRGTCRPGLLLIRPSHYSQCQQQSTSPDPDSLQKWAEEGFLVIQITFKGTHVVSLMEAIKIAKKGLAESFPCKVYGYPSDFQSGFKVSLQKTLAEEEDLVAVVYHDRWELSHCTKGIMHVPGAKCSGPLEKNVTKHIYADAVSPGFVIPGHPDFIKSTAAVVHTRSLTFLKMHLGEIFDLEDLWDRFLHHQLDERSVEKTMAMMVQEPCVNHVPTMTGGIGREQMSHFYLHSFITNNPEDTTLERVSRTVGANSLVDEFILHLSHSMVIDWLLPEVPPTGKKLRIPCTAVVHFRGDRIVQEHIAWDQATVLVQLGLLPEWLPFPYPLPDGRVPDTGHHFEYRVPAAGMECAKKLQNFHSVLSNEMLHHGIRQVKDK